MADGSLTFDTKIDSGGFSSGMGKIKSLASTALGVFTGNLMTKAVDGMKELGKTALDSVSSYEQNVGGIETLFGAGGDSIEEYAKSVGKSVSAVKGDYNQLMNAQSTVMKNAQNAYKTAGLSANDYMETVSSFAASLKQSTSNSGEAAKVADMAVVDMADNANKMGTSMDAIQNAYSGFAKQNYTMLDNLKLGYGGTKTEMERLLKDASKISGQKYDISNLKDVYSAIHVIQGQLGITGTTAKEASTTIEGSMNSAKAAWDNFMNGSGDASELADAFGTAAQNIVKNLAEIIPRLAGTIPALIGAVVPQIPGLVSALVPAVVSSVQALLEEIGAVAQGFDWAGMAQKVVDGINAFISGDGLGKFLNNVTAILGDIANGIAQALPILLPAIVKLILYIGENLIEQVPTLIQDGITLLKGLAEGFVEALPLIMQAMAQLGTTIGSALQAVGTKIGEFVTEVWNKFTEWGAGIVSRAATAMSGLLSTVVAWISQLPGQMWTWLVNTVTNIVLWGQNMYTNASTAMSNMISTVIQWISQLPGRIWTWLVNVVTNVIAWGQNMRTQASTAASGFISNVITWMSQLPGKVGTWLTSTISKALQFVADMKAKATEAAKGFFDNIVDGLKALPEKMAEIGGDIVKGIWNGIKGGWKWLKDKVAGLADDLLQAAKDALKIGSPSKVFRDEVGKWILPGVQVGMDKSLPDALQGMRDNVSALVAEAQNSVADVSTQMSAGAGTTAALRASSGLGTTVYNDNHVDQTNTYQVPVASPYEVAKTQRAAVRKLVGGVA